MHFNFFFYNFYINKFSNCILFTFLFLYFCEKQRFLAPLKSKFSGCIIQHQSIFLPEPDSKKWPDIDQSEPDIMYIIRKQQAKQYWPVRWSSNKYKVHFSISYNLELCSSLQLAMAINDGSCLHPVISSAQHITWQLHFTDYTT